MRQQRLLGLLLLAAVSAPMAANAAPVAANTATINQTKPNLLTPYQLVFMAYQGQFRSVGIPGSQPLANDYQWAQLSAKGLVEKAVQANLLPESVLKDRGYISAVDANLSALKSNSH